MNITPEELSAALTTFIKSGSANGNEAMRKECLRLVPAIAEVPAMLEVLQSIVDQFIDTDAPLGLKAAEILKRIEG